MAPVLLLGACAHSPAGPGGLPWWPQGPGTLPPDVATETPAATAAHDAGRVGPAALLESPLAVRYGDLVFVAGQPGGNAGSQQSIQDSLATQLRTAMAAVERALASQGMTMSNIVALTLYLTDMRQLEAIDALYPGYFPRALPARTVVEVAGLPGSSALQIAVIAGR